MSSPALEFPSTLGNPKFQKVCGKPTKLWAIQKSWAECGVPNFFMIPFMCRCVSRWVMGCHACRGKSHIFRLQVSNPWCRRLRLAVRTRCFGLIYSQYVWSESVGCMTSRCRSIFIKAWSYTVVTQQLFGGATSIGCLWLKWSQDFLVQRLASKHRWRFAPSWANSKAQCAGQC